MNGFAQQAHILEQIGLKYQPNMRHRERIQKNIVLGTAEDSAMCREEMFAGVDTGRRHE